MIGRSSDFPSISSPSRPAFGPGAHVPFQEGPYEKALPTGRNTRPAVTVTFHPVTIPAGTLLTGWRPASGRIVDRWGYSTGHCAAASHRLPFSPASGPAPVQSLSRRSRRLFCGHRSCVQRSWNTEPLLTGIGALVNGIDGLTTDECTQRHEGRKDNHVLSLIKKPVFPSTDQRRATVEWSPIFSVHHQSETLNGKPLNLNAPLCRGCLCVTYRMAVGR